MVNVYFKRTYVLIIFLYISSTLSAISYVYKPGAGSDKQWNTAANWLPNGIPGASDNVTISDSVSVTSNVTVNNLTLNGTGRINCAARLTINGICDWTSGNFHGTGTVKLASSSTTAISGNSNKEMFRLTIDNEGYITWSGNGEIKLNRDAHLINRSSGTVEIRNNSRLDYVQKYHGGYLTNYGTIRKTASVGGGYSESQIDPVLINYGTMSTEAGVLQIERGDSTTASDGTFHVAAGCTLNYIDRPFRCDDASFTGNGLVQVVVNGGTRPTFIVSGDGVTFSAGLTFRLNVDYNTPADGYISGDGPILVNGNFIWDQGVILGTGSFTVNGNTTFPGNSGTKILDSRTLILNGNSIYSSTRSLVFRNGAMIINGSGATFEKTSTAIWDSTTGIASGTFRNDGTFVYVNSGTMNIRVDFINNGTFIDQSGGILVFRKGFVNTATGNISGVGTLDVRRGFSHSGSISPGNPTGRLTILGNISL